MSALLDSPPAVSPPTVLEVIRRYQDIDPATGRFGGIRTQEAYAAVLGCTAVSLSRFYHGRRHGKRDVVIAFLRTFPEAALELAEALAAEDELVGVA